jgi:hypothetical protein
VRSAMPLGQRRTALHDTSYGTGVGETLQARVRSLADHSEQSAVVVLQKDESQTWSFAALASNLQHAVVETRRRVLGVGAPGRGILRRKLP